MEDEALQKIKEKREIYKSCFIGKDGEYVLNDLASYCYYNKHIYSANALEMAFKEGMRTVYLYIKRLIQEEKKNEES